MKSYLITVKAAGEINFDQVLLAGDSAGGYLAIQSALTQPADTIKAVIAMYPMIDMRSDFFTKKYDKLILGHGPVPYEIVEDHLRTITPESIVSSAIPPARLDLAISIV